jgi:LysM repeat protein
VNHEVPYRNQAERLRQKIEKVKDGGDVIIVKSELPSRTDIHRNKKNKTKLKVKFPIIRLLALFFILLPVVIISAYSVLGSKEINNSDKVSTLDRGGYEINVEDSDVLEPVGEEITEETLPIEEVEVIVDTEEEKNENASDEETIETVKEEESGTTNQTSTDKEQIQTDTSNKGETTSNNNLVYHTVQPNENLFRIALKYYQSQSGIEIIQKANNLNGNEIMVGQVLKIPK